MDNETLITDASDIRINEQDQVQAILGRPPRWILRWGITFVFLAVMVLILIGWLVKFPDIIPARVVLTTEVPPVHIFAQTEGKLATLLVKDKQKIIANELLGVIENTASYDDVEQLEHFLNKIKNKKSRDLAKVDYPTGLILGELQNSFSVFTQNLNDFSFFQNKSENRKKIRALKKQMSYLGRMNSSLKKQEKTLQGAIDLANSNWQRMVALEQNKSVSKREVEDAKSNVLRSKRELEKLQTERLNNKLRIKELELNIIDLKENRSDGKNRKSISLKENIETLLSDIEQWKQKYLILAPMDGQVSFPAVLNKNQFVKKGEEIMTIVPKGGMGELVGNAWLPAANSGKVEEGMEVNIRLDGFPYQEFGVVKATVKSKSILPQGGQYLLVLQMPDELITTYGKPISFQQEMQGTANIITEDRRVLERIFDRFLSLMKNR